MGLVACGWKKGMREEEKKGERARQNTGWGCKRLERRGPRHPRPGGPRCPGHGRDAENNLGEAATLGLFSLVNGEGLCEGQPRSTPGPPTPRRRRGLGRARFPPRAGRHGRAAWLRGRRKERREGALCGSLKRKRGARRSALLLAMGGEGLASANAAPGMATPTLHRTPQPRHGKERHVAAGRVAHRFWTKRGPRQDKTHGHVHSGRCGSQKPTRFSRQSGGSTRKASLGASWGWGCLLVLGPRWDAGVAPGGKDKAPFSGPGAGLSSCPRDNKASPSLLPF